MAIYLKKFENHSAYEASQSGLILPNVSLCVQENEVHYNPSSPTPPIPTETRVVCKYNVEDTEYKTSLCNDTTNFSAMEIDGVEQAEIVYSYQFDTLGEHTVKFTLTDPSSIGDSAFNDCSSLTSVTIPNSVTSIGNFCFEYSDSITRLNSDIDGVFILPSNITSIGDGAFQYCRSLTSITMPNSVTSIGSICFEECNYLINVTIEATIPPTAGNGIFNYTPDEMKIYVPSGSVDTYKSASGWSSYASRIQPIA